MCYVRTTSYRLVDHGPWVLQDVNYNVYRDHIFQTGSNKHPLKRNMNGTPTMIMFLAMRIEVKT